MDLGHIGASCIRDCHDDRNQYGMDDNYQAGEGHFLKDSQVRLKLMTPSPLKVPSSYDDPFHHPIDYAPTDKDAIDRATNHARRLLSPHTLVLQMLFSRLQAAKYRRPGLMSLIQRLVLRSARAYRTLRLCSHRDPRSPHTKDCCSTHALAREARFSFLIFGLEALGGSRLDSYCEYALRESLYAAAFSWFSVRPQ
jgi:phosphatidylinositol 4-kinase